MKANVNGTDKAVRILAAVFLIVLYITKIISGTAGIFLLAFGGILLITAFVNFCPIYHFLGISTKKKTSQSPEK